MVLVAALGTTTAALPDAGRWRQHEFVVGGLYSGDPFQPRRLLDLEEAGLDLVVNGDRSDRVDVERTARSLDSLARARPEFGLRLIAADHNAPPGERVSSNPDARGNRARIARATDPSSGMNRGSVAGWYVWDEPMSEADFLSAGRTISLLDSLPATRSQLAYVNLLPGAAADRASFKRIYGADKATAYRRYLDRVLAMYRDAGVPVPLLSVDHYPFQTARHRTDGYFTLRTLAAAAASVSDSVPPPLWVIVQLSHWRDRSGQYRDEPTVPEIRSQVSTALVYGAKGILYWTLSPSGSGEFGPGLLDRAGARTAIYDSVRAINRVLRAWGPTLMRLTPGPVLHQSTAGLEGIGTDRFDAAARPPSAVAAMSGGADQGMVGTLRDRAGGEDWLLVVNKGLDAAATFTITLARDVAGVDRMDDDGATHPVPLTSRRFTVPGLPPGGAALIRLRAR